MRGAAPPPDYNHVRKDILRVVHGLTWFQTHSYRLPAKTYRHSSSRRLRTGLEKPFFNRCIHYLPDIKFIFPVYKSRDMQVKRLSVFHQMLENSSHKGNYMPESTGIAGFSGRKRVGELQVTSDGATSDERQSDERQSDGGGSKYKDAKSVMQL